MKWLIVGGILYLLYHRYWAPTRPALAKAPPPAEVDGEDAYRILGLTPGADLETITKRYHRLVGEHHPDRHPDDPAGANARTQKINRAFSAVRARLENRNR